MLKRTFDVAVSLWGLIATSPVLALLAFFVKASSTGPVFYRGQRVGLHGKPFRIIKFRSMVINAEQIGGSSTGDHDPRIAR